MCVEIFVKLKSVVICIQFPKFRSDARPMPCKSIWIAWSIYDSKYEIVLKLKANCTFDRVRNQFQLHIQESNSIWGASQLFEAFETFRQ